MINRFPSRSVVCAATLIAGATIGGYQSPTLAATVTYNFTVKVSQGSLAGNSYNGTFTYDDSQVKGTGIEELGVDRGLTVCMNYFGRTYHETDDTSHPNFPKLIFKDGKIQQLDFWVQPNQRVKWWNLSGWDVNLSLVKDKSEPKNCQKP